jgi:hypothetical protein
MIVNCRCVACRGRVPLLLLMFKERLLSFNYISCPSFVFSSAIHLHHGPTSERENYGPRTIKRPPRCRQHLFGSTTYITLNTEKYTYTSHYNMSDLCVPCRAPYTSPVIEEDDGMVIIEAGRGVNEQVFVVHAPSLLNCSEYFRER